MLLIFCQTCRSIHDSYDFVVRHLDSLDGHNKNVQVQMVVGKMRGCEWQQVNWYKILG